MKRQLDQESELEPDGYIGGGRDPYLEFGISDKFEDLPEGTKVGTP
jgi:hypothetical protein